MQGRTGQKIAECALMLFAGLVMAIFAGCGSRTMRVSLPLDSPERFSQSGAQEMPDEWWTAFGDTALDRLVGQALQSNFSLESAWQRFREAQAIADREAAGLFPNIASFFDGEVRRPEFRNTQQFQLGLTADYELDLWGRIRASIDAEQFRASATLADYLAAALSLSAEIVRTWYRVIEARNQLWLVEQQIETNEKVLQSLKTRFGSGQIRGVDILRQQELLEATREQKIVAESRIAVVQHQLAVLLGRSPWEEIDSARVRLPQLPLLPETGVPMELVRRRPDVQSAFRELKAADSDLAAAISNQYPRLTLSASVSTYSENASNLFEEWARSFTGSLLAPLFYGGRLSAEVDRTEAVKNQLLYEYGQTILTAFQEVEDALILEQKQVERIRSLEQQLGFARQTYEQLRIEYFNGFADYLDVLTALTDQQQLQRDVLAAHLTLLEYRIALYRALAGGIETGRDVERN
ncbi:efflux transporter outer membrane subunit [candidate division KSB1 bacterium]|nr:efflux transporter outer membrane subunit [candidate division KSB1 bacterium]